MLEKPLKKNLTIYIHLNLKRISKVTKLKVYKTIKL